MLGVKSQTDTNAEKSKQNNSLWFLPGSRPHMARWIAAADRDPAQPNVDFAQAQQ